MKVVIGRIDHATSARVIQLLGKTNQFNVATRRYSESDSPARDGHASELAAVGVSK